MVRSLQQISLIAANVIAGIAVASSAGGQSAPKRTIRDINIGVYRHETRLTAGLRLSDGQLASVDSLNTVYEPAFRDAVRNVHPGMTPIEKAQFQTIVRRLLADRERDFRSLLSPNQRATYSANRATIAAFPRRLNSTPKVEAWSLSKSAK
jgi:hypothetical protein